MESSLKKEMISERSNNINRNTDLSQNSLLSSQLSKKTSDKKTPEIKPMEQLDLDNDKNINRKIKKQIDNDSLHTLDYYDNEISQRKKVDKNKKKKKKTPSKIIVDDIENIYSTLVDKTNVMYTVQKIMLLLIVFAVNICHWVFLFLAKQKLENNYYFTDLNQFDNSITTHICKNHEQKINLFLYNDTLDCFNRSLSEHQIFIKEMKLVNELYKPFFVRHNYQMSKDKILSYIDMIQYSGDKINFSIILTKKEKWSIFLQFYSLCLQDKSYIYFIVVVIMGGMMGSIIFGLLADIYGRKKLITALLLLITISFTIVSALNLFLDKKYDHFLNEYNQKFGKNHTHYHILSVMYSQKETSKLFEKNMAKYVFAIFLLSLALRPLGKICLACLLENSVSELNVLENFRLYTSVATGLPPFFAFINFVLVNNFMISVLLMNAIFFLLFIMAFFCVKESMRYHYEYSKWKDLTEEIMELFKITDDVPLNYKNKIEFEAFKIEENRNMWGNNLKNINSVFALVKQRVISLNRDIRRNSVFIIKKDEVKFNPLIIYTSLSANRVLFRLKTLMLIILIIIYIQVFFVEKEFIEVPFFKFSDLVFGHKYNIIINNNYFILLLFTLFSNYFFFICYRISCFKLLFYFSLTIVTFFFMLYHVLSYIEQDFPLDLNQTNFYMLDEHNRKNSIKGLNYLLLFIHLFLNGINFYINILAIKITKTLYRCSLFGVNTCLALLALAFGEALNYQIKHTFLLIGALNIIGIVSEFYFGELKGIPNIINDLKQHINRENKNREKSKKL